MKTLLVDNGSTLTTKLAQLTPGEVEICSYDAIPNIVTNYGLILLSGSSQFPVEGNEQILNDEFALVLNATVPVIGICLGHEIIAKALGGTIENLHHQHVGLTKVNIVQEHDMFGGAKQFTVYENHRYGLKEVPDSFEVLAETDHAVAVMRHKTRQIYGMQFHPEHHVEHQFGDEVFLNLISSLVK